MKSNPIQIIKGSEAYAAVSGTALYPHPDKDPERLHPIANLEHEPKFKIPKDGKIFAIGSCFAREIEKAMFSLGMDVVSYKTIHEQESDKFRYITNKYTPTSILHDLKLATGGFTESDVNAGVVKISPKNSRCANYQFGGGNSLDTASHEEVASAYRRLLTNMSLIKQCDLVVITLGLVEAWYDKTEQTYLNISPHKSTVKNNPDRYELHVLSYDQIMSCLKEIYKTLQESAEVEQNILITVSPVPLHATYRGQDVLQANCYSKSVLRAAVEEFVTQNPSIAYFPSYEMVTLTSPDKVWKGADYRHVSPNMVAKIMQASINNYLESDMPSKITFQELIKKKSYSEVVELFESIEIEPHLLRAYAFYYAGIAYYNLADMQNSKRNLEVTLEFFPKHLFATTLLAKINVQEGKREEAICLLEKISADHPPAEKFLNELKDI